MVSRFPMNTKDSVICLLTSVALTGVSAAAPDGKGVQDSPSFDDASLARRKALAVEPLKTLKPTTGEDPAKAMQPRDILADSDIICFQGAATLVPKRAILVTPKNYEAYLKFQSGAKFVSWSEFYTANRGWITTVEVSRNQAEGTEPLNDQTQKMLGTSRNLVVATFKGGPISVLAPKDSKNTTPARNGAADPSKQPVRP